MSHDECEDFKNMLQKWMTTTDQRLDDLTKEVTKSAQFRNRLIGGALGVAALFSGAFNHFIELFRGD